MNITDFIDLSLPKIIGIYGNNKKEKFKTLLKLHQKIQKKSIFISFKFNEELKNYFNNSNFSQVERLDVLNKETYFNKNISLEEEEKTLLNLFKIIIKSKINEHYYIFLDETILTDKLISLLKISKLKNISIIYSSKTISKELFLLTDEKLYGKTLSPSGINLISEKTGVEKEKLKNMEEDDYVYKLNNGNSIIGKA